MSDVMRPVRGMIFVGAGIYVGEPDDLWMHKNAYDVLAARLDRAERALLIERGKLEQADALCESLQNKLASRPLSAGDTDALEARVAELEANLNYIRTVCDNMLDTQPDADWEKP
jgi:hypothetical protein